MLVRQPAVAGMFYPRSASELQHTLDRLLANARAERDDRRSGPATSLRSAPKALVVPHAGYIYSGPTAACGYAQLDVAADHIRRVVLLGPTHRVPVGGMALPGCERFATPLGEVPIDTNGAALLERLPQVVTSTAAHAKEHSLEVHVPFLQTVLHDGWTLLPLAVSRCTPAQVAEVLDAVWGGSETLIVISTDLSHFHSYAEAERLDGDTVARVLALRTDINHDQACGATPLNGLVEMARRRRLSPSLLSMCNSGDTAGDHDRVVGYASLQFEERVGV